MSLISAWRLRLLGPLSGPRDHDDFYQVHVNYFIMNESIFSRETKESP